MLEQAHRILAEAGLDYRDLNFMRQGGQHNLLRVTLPQGQHVLKMARDDVHFDDVFDRDRKHLSGLRAEAQAVQAVVGVGTPSPVRILSERPPAALMPYMPGESGQSLWDKGRLNEKSLMSLCTAMGEALAEVHRCRRPADPGNIPDHPDLEPGKGRLLHMDYHLGNVQVVPDRRRGGFQVRSVLDWVLCRWGPREADLVEMSISVFRQFPEARAAFLAGYRRGGGMMLDRKIENRLTARELRRRLAHDAELPKKVRQRWEAWADQLETGRKPVKL